MSELKLVKFNARQRPNDRFNLKSRDQLKKAAKAYPIGVKFLKINQLLDNEGTICPAICTDVSRAWGVVHGRNAWILIIVHPNVKATLHYLNWRVEREGGEGGRGQEAVTVTPWDWSWCEMVNNWAQEGWNWMLWNRAIWEDDGNCAL